MSFFGLFGDPYKDAMKQLKKYGQQAQQQQQPYQNAGVGAIGDYQNWLQGQKNPGEFINNLRNDYQQSPYNQYLQEQAQAAGQNAASASGLLGSTPFAQFQQQNAGNIAQQGMNDWLQNVLGINTQYGQGQQNLMAGGQGAANSLSNLFQNMGQNMGQGAFGSRNYQNQNWGNLLGTIAKMFL